MLDRNRYMPLYCQLEEEILRQIETGEIKPGDKLPSESEMIQQYNIGRPTIRMALSQLVNKGYLEKKHGKGTFCKTAKLDGEELNINVILDMGDTYFIPYYMRSISKVLTACKCNFIVSDSKNSSEEICRLLKSILSKGTSGVILQPSHNNENVTQELEECFQMYRNAGVPCLMIDCAYNIPDASYMMLDEHHGGNMAGQYLQGLGHTKALAVYMKEYKDSILRLEGFCHAYESVGKEMPILLPYNKDAFEEELMEMLAEQKPTAIFCYNDEVAVECIRILRAHNISVPDTVSVMGFDDSVLAASCVPPLTTILHPKQELGEMAAKVLLELIHKKRPWPYVNLVSPSLVIRESCK